MKTFKMAFFASLLISTSAAHAELSYKWVKMNSNQEKAFVDNCFELQKANAWNGAEAVGMAAAGVVAIGVMSTTATEGSGAVLFSSIPGGVGAGVITGAGVEAYMTIRSFFNISHIKELVVEQQTGRPGMMTEMLEQVAAENQVDGNKMLALLNTSALRKELCQAGERAYMSGIKDLAAGQIYDREEAKRNVLNAARAAESERLAKIAADKKAEANAELAKANAELNVQLGQIDRQIK